MADFFAADKKVAATGTGDDTVPESQPPHEMTAMEYALTRFSTLKPPMHKAPNPIHLLMMLSGKQWLFFLVAFLAWVGRELHPAPARY
jgi:SHS family lactate transporter-like MFS transporter